MVERYCPWFLRVGTLHTIFALSTYYFYLFINGTLLLSDRKLNN